MAKTKHKFPPAPHQLEHSEWHKLRYDQRDVTPDDEPPQYDDGPDEFTGNTDPFAHMHMPRPLDGALLPPNWRSLSKTLLVALLSSAASHDTVRHMHRMKRRDLVNAIEGLLRAQDSRTTTL